MKVSVILPTYNEANGIVSLIRDILENFKKKPDFEPEILVIDDASPDKTAEVARSQYGEDARVKVLIRQKEKGLSTAIKFGIRNATGEIILFMDADGNHDPKYIPILLDLIKYYEVVMGTRYGWGGGMDASRFRYWGSYFFNIFIKAVLRIESSDNTSGYIMVRKNILDSLNLDEIFQGYGEWFFSLLYAFKDKVKDFVEIPIYYPKRRGGKSKTDFFHTFFIYALRVISLRLKKDKLKTMNEAPKKSFYILFAIACFLGAILFNLTDLTILSRSLIAGQNYNFFSFATGDARGTLLPAYRDILYGNWFGSDGMTYENTYLPAVRPYFNYWLVSPLILLFKSYNIYLPLGRFLMAILVFVLVYKLAKHLIGNRYGSLLFSSVFLSGGYIFSFFFPWSSENFSTVARSFLPFGSPAAEILLGKYNSVSTFPGLAILAAGFLFLYLAIVSDKKRYTILAGIFAGLLLDNYPTSGLYIWAVSGVMFLIFIFRKDFAGAKKILWIYFLSAIVGLPFFINQVSLRMLPWADEVYRRVGGEMAMGFRTSQWLNYILFTVFAVWLWRWGKSRGREKEATYLVAFMLSPILLLNMQVIAGYNPVGSEWFDHQFYFGFAFCWLVLFYEIYNWLKNKNKKFANIALAVIIVLFIGRTAVASIVKSDLYRYNYLPKGIEASFKWLNKNTELNSVIISPSLVMNYLFADDTHNRILITSGTNSSMPQWEIMDRWFVLYKIFGVSPDYLEQALRGRLPKSSDPAAGAEYDLLQGGDNGLTGAMFYYYFGDKSLDTYFRSQQTDVPERELAKIIADYKKYPADLCYLLSKYRIDYFYIGPLERAIIAIDADKLNWLDKVYDSGGIKIYKIQKDAALNKCGKK